MANNVNIEQSVITTLQVYPNPVVEEIHIESSETIEAVRIIDAIGRTVYSSHSSESTHNLSHLESGCYIIEIITNKTTHVKTIIQL